VDTRRALASRGERRLEPSERDEDVLDVDLDRERRLEGEREESSKDMTTKGRG